MRTFTVSHTFKAEEDVELTVRKGEAVDAVDNVIQDGWIKVQVHSDPSRHGFVPMSYLKENGAKKDTNAASEKLSPSRAQAETTPRRPTAQSSAAAKTPVAASPVGTDAAGGLDVSSVRASPYHSTPAKPQPQPQQQQQQPSAERAARPVERQEQQQQQPLSASTLTPAQACAGPVSRTLLRNPDAVVESFMKNEVYFKQLMRKRAEAITGMQNSLEEAMTEVAACKDRNAALARKLRDLDQAIEREHHRWEDRVVEEKDYISRSLAYTSGGSGGAGSLLALEGGFASTQSTPRRGITTANEL